LIVTIDALKASFRNTRPTRSSSAWLFTVSAQGFNRLAQGKGSFPVSAGEGNG
jgi:hypothetical protein